MSDLKPCPFCGNDKPILYRDPLSPMAQKWGIYCRTSDCGGNVEAFMTREEATAAWNSRRAPDARTEVDAARYRWLRTRQTEIIINSPISPERSEALDIAIDNAMRDRQP